MSVVAENAWDTQMLSSGARLSFSINETQKAEDHGGLAHSYDPFQPAL